jgi:hypothetical protein
VCEHGINIDQLKLAIAQSDDALAMVQQWMEQLHHLADHGQLPDASAALAQASVLLGETRGKLQVAIDDLEDDENDSVSVELV